MKGIFGQIRWAVLVVMLHVAADGATNGLVVHEWGTFTALQDESGRCLDGINTDDEPVPSFVHQLAQSSLVQTSSEVPAFLFQGAPFAYPNVTLRLETPVIYFHPAEGGAAPTEVDVKVRFLGGLLTEYYPKPERAEPAVQLNERKTVIRPSVEGLLEWSNLKIGGSAPGPATEDRVWLAPRAVKAADVRAGNGESERFLFYRGLGTGEALLKVVRETDHFSIRATVPAGIKTDLKIRRLWLVDIRGDDVAFRAIEGFTIPQTSGRVLKRVRSGFSDSEYSPANRTKLRSALLDTLKEEGLFEDEAVALLETWKISYFESSGLRLFFIVPREWTDHVLPLEIEKADEIVRAMVGRIELISPRQREMLANIDKKSAREIQNAAKEMHTRVMKGLYPNLYSQDQKQTAQNMTNVSLVFTGRMKLAEVGIEAVPVYKTYLELGRFRHTLVKNSATNAPGLTAFVEAFRL